MPAWEQNWSLTVSKPNTIFAAAAAFGLMYGTAAHASLATFQSFVGSDGLSTGGCGSTSQACSFTSIVPTGSTVLGAYLYSSLFDASSNNIPGGTLDGSTVNYATALGTNGADLEAYRADVTSIVAPIVAGASSSTLTFNVTETNQYQDGEALVIAYSNASLPTQTVGILDGFSATTGDSSTINFATPLNPSAPGFVADFRIGDGFSYDGAGCTASSQVSLVKVNGSALTNVAGCNDDSTDAVPSNGNLITVGSDTDPFTPIVAGGENVTADDHERYNLASFIKKGDTSINVNTVNPSGDDNIFLETFLVSGAGGVNAPPPSTNVPEPSAMILFGTGLIALAAVSSKGSRRAFP